VHDQAQTRQVFEWDVEQMCIGVDKNGSNFGFELIKEFCGWFELLSKENQIP
jgi:hypothetical protein